MDKYTLPAASTSASTGRTMLEDMIRIQRELDAWQPCRTHEDVFLFRAHEWEAIKANLLGREFEGTRMEADMRMNRLLGVAVYVVYTEAEFWRLLHELQCVRKYHGGVLKAVPIPPRK